MRTLLQFPRHLRGGPVSMKQTQAKFWIAIYPPHQDIVKKEKEEVIALP